MIISSNPAAKLIKFWYRCINFCGIYIFHLLKAQCHFSSISDIFDFDTINQNKQEDFVMKNVELLISMFVVCGVCVFGVLWYSNYFYLT